ncbi:MAG: AzlD domain-containing protein [Eubacterium sp.]|nr:AzlD domain-containing protein [Eubacterium sp.]
MNIWIYILVMAGVTYLIRMLPLTLIQKPIRSRFMKSFLYYIPYAVLASMTFPAIFYVCQNRTAAVIGTVISLVLAFFRMPLIVVALAAAASVYLSGLLF